MIGFFFNTSEDEATLTTSVSTHIIKLNIHGLVIISAPGRVSLNDRVVELPSEYLCVYLQFSAVFILGQRSFFCCSGQKTMQ